MGCGTRSPDRSSRQSPPVCAVRRARLYSRRRFGGSQYCVRRRRRGAGALPPSSRPCYREAERGAAGRLHQTLVIVGEPCDAPHRVGVSCLSLAPLYPHFRLASFNYFVRVCRLLLPVTRLAHAFNRSYPTSPTPPSPADAPRAPSYPAFGRMPRAAPSRTPQPQPPPDPASAPPPGPRSPPPPHPAPPRRRPRR